MIRLLLCVSILCQILSAESIKFVTGEYPPFTGEKLKHYGASTEVITAVLKELEITPEYLFLPWKRGYHMVNNQTILGTFPYAITHSRQKEMLYSDAINYVEGRFFYKVTQMKNIPHDWSVKTLQQYRIGVPLGYSTQEQLQAQGITTIMFPDENKMYMALDRGDVDFIAMPEIPGWAFIRNIFGRHVRLFAALEKPYAHDTLHVIVSKNHPDGAQFIKRFDSALKQIRKNGVYENIMQKYRVRMHDAD